VLLEPGGLGPSRQPMPRHPSQLAKAAATSLSLPRGLFVRQHRAVHGTCLCSQAATDTLDCADTDGVTSTRTSHAANYPPDWLAMTAANTRQERNDGPETSKRLASKDLRSCGAANRTSCAHVRGVFLRVRAYVRKAKISAAHHRHATINQRISSRC
jgi:hypothetical protein